MSRFARRDHAAPCRFVTFVRSVLKPVLSVTSRRAAISGL